MKVIAFSGWRQSGKDTSADYLVKNFGFKKLSFAEVLKDMVAEQYNIPRQYCDDSEYKEQPLLQYPVDPKDDFSRLVCRYMTKEFATVFGDGTVGKQSSALSEPWHQFDMYWTPRALCILEGSVKRSVNSKYWTQRVINNIKNESQIGTVTAYGMVAFPQKITKIDPQDKFVISDLRYASEVEQLKEAFGDDLILVRINRWDGSPSSDPSETDLNDYSFTYRINNKKDIKNLYLCLDTLTPYWLR